MTARVAIGEVDVRRLLAVVSEERGDPPAEGLPPSLLRDLTGVVGCDFLTFFALDAARQVTGFGQGVQGSADDEDADDEAEDDGPFWAHYWDCAPCSYPDRSGDLRSVTKVSDFYSGRQWRSTGMYRDYLHGQIEHELIMCLPAGPRQAGLPGQSLRLVFFRGAGPDFSERDRALIALLRPHLHEAYLAAERRRHGPAELTPRQRELLRLVAEGHTNVQIGRCLGLSEGTVRKHLENIFDRLDVSSRTAAVIRAFPDRAAG
jgi:DNA-binding CsgD family transcriptional regulator